MMDMMYREASPVSVTLLEVRPKVVRVKTVAKKPRRDSLEISISRQRKAPNKSRMNNVAKLVAFPSFDRCDSLLFFPSTLTACVNSGDMAGLSKLVASRIDKACAVSMANLDITGQDLVSIFDLMDQLHPDQIIIVHSTKIVGNTIRAEMVFKYTDNLTIRKSMEKAFPDPRLIKACAGPRSDPDLLPLYLLSQPENERFSVAAHLTNSEDVVVHGRGTMILTFDYYSKHVTRLDMQCSVASFDFI
jgi:hypothetical protein